MLDQEEKMEHPESPDLGDLEASTVSKEIVVLQDELEPLGHLELMVVLAGEDDRDDVAEEDHLDQAETPDQKELLETVVSEDELDEQEDQDQ